MWLVGTSSEPALAEDLIRDGWTAHTELFREAVRSQASKAELKAALRKSIETAEEKNRKRVSETVLDPEIAAALTPRYGLYCKRPCFHDEYLETFNRPNVTLLMASAGALEDVTEEGIRVAGQLYEVDCIIFATGFPFPHDFPAFARCIGFPITGPDGEQIETTWSNGAQSYFGICTEGVPNLWFTTGPFGGIFFGNFAHYLDKAGSVVAAIIAMARRAGALRVGVRSEAAEEYMKWFSQNRRAGVLLNPNCVPGYYNNFGRIPKGRAPSEQCNPHFFFEFAQSFALARFEADFTLVC